MSLTRQRFHKENRNIVCFCCLNKDVKCHKLENNPALQELIILYVDPGFCLEINSLPSGVCSTCKKCLHLKKNEGYVSQNIEDMWKIGRVLLRKLGRLQDTSLCTCPICCIAKEKRSHRKINLSEFIEDFGFKHKSSDVNNTSFCTDCCQKVGKGIRHPCTKSEIVQNLHKLILSQDSKTSQQVISSVLKDMHKTSENNELTLATGGKALHVALYSGDVHKPILEISSDTLFSIKKKMDLPMSAMDCIMTEIRKDLGRGGIEPNASKIIKDKSFQLNEFYKNVLCSFQQTHNKGKYKVVDKIQKDVVFVPEPWELIKKICEHRKLNPYNCLIRVGIDGGQGSLKVIMNIFNPEELQSEKRNMKNTGVNTVLILGLVRGVQESNYNLERLIKLLKLNELKYTVAADLKLINCLLGISAHWGKYACCYCEGEKNDKNGKLRTFQSLTSWYQKFIEDGELNKDMKSYKNVVRPCLIEESGETLVIDIVPPPELHLFEHIVTQITDVLMAEESIKKFLIGKNVTRHGYNGGGFDGPNCQKVLSCLDELITIAPLLMIPCIETLRKFKIVTERCFGMRLSLEFSRDIQEFVSEMCNLHKYLIEYTTHKICLGWKFHIIQSHLVMFLERKNKPLGIFSEQSCEAVHKNINKTMKRFAASELSKCHGEKLRKMAVTYSSMRM